jgi:hypothetical protein
MAPKVSRPIHAAKPAVSKISQTPGMLAFCAQQRADASGQGRLSPSSRLARGNARCLLGASPLGRRRRGR